MIEDLREENLKILNDIPDSIFRNFLIRCCGSTRWIDCMVYEKPFTSMEDLFHVADFTWNSLPESEWKIAFSCHPRIGDRESLIKKFSHTTWESNEQKGAEHASEEVLSDLERLNRAYEEKFGFIFLICATGKSAEEMLLSIKERINNPPGEEIIIAAGEQAKITKLRLLKVIDEVSRSPKL